MGQVLVAGADEEIVQRIAAALTRVGYRVEAARDGREALDRLRNEAFDLLILDPIMPRMDGFELLKAIQVHPLARPLPIIVCVALWARVDDNEEVRARLRSLGAADFIVKYRMKPSDVVQAVQRVFPPGG